MSRLTRSPPHSPSFLADRHFRSTNSASPSPNGNQAAAKKSILLSENQLNHVKNQQKDECNNIDYFRSIKRLPPFDMVHRQMPLFQIV